jgi:muramidase (phage lysozyme)
VKNPKQNLICLSSIGPAKVHALLQAGSLEKKVEKVQRLETPWDSLYTIEKEFPS